MPEGRCCSNQCAPQPPLPESRLLGVALHHMKLYRFCLLLGATVALACNALSEDAPQTSHAEPQPALSPAGLGALEHASKLIIAINNLDWQTVESATPKNEASLSILKRLATASKDWPGIGAYRGYDQKDGTLTLRFAYGGRSTPHEIWFKYSLGDAKFTYQGYEILGW
jgi:hypothetical protein